MRTLILTLSTVLVSCGMAMAKDKEPSTKFQYGFIENKGQVMDQNNQPNNNVQYLLCAPGLNVQLRRGGFSYDTYTTEVTGQREMPVGEPIPEMSYSYQRIDVELEGANTNCKIIAEQPAADYINYYTNGLRLPNVHHYSKVTYKDIYAGIDLEFTINPASGKAVEYNFIVAPGANPSQIKLRYEGAETTRLVDNKILLKLENDEIAETIPASYTALSRVPVAVKYQQLGGNTFGFSVPAYNSKETLVIDPTPSRTWSTYLGGPANDFARELVISGSNLYLVAGCLSNTQIATTGAYKTTKTGYWDAVVAQYTTNGVLNWATYYGGDEDDDATGIVVNANSDIYIGGSTHSLNGIATTGVHQPAYGGGSRDAFIAKFNSSGSLQWGTYYGGLSTDEIYAAAIDPSGNIYFCGSTGSTNSIATTGAAQYTNAGNIDAFIVKFNAGGVRQWGTYAGEANNDNGVSVATDLLGNVFMSGTSANSFSPINLTVAGVHQPSYGGGANDCFVEKYNATGTRLWGTFYGGSGDDGGRITTDATGSVYISGSTSSATGIATTGTAMTSKNSTTDGFVAKLTPSGYREWGTYYGAVNGDTWLSSIKVQGHDAYVTGYTLAPGLASAGAYQTTKSLYEDGCIARLNSGNGTMVWSTYYGGTDIDAPFGLVIDGSSLYISGTTVSTTGFGSPGAQQTTNNGGRDIFLTRFDCLNLFSATATATKTCFNQQNGTITVTPSGGVPPYGYKTGSSGFQVSNIITNLMGGVHTVTIMDNEGCTATLNQSVQAHGEIKLPAIFGKINVEKQEAGIYSTVSIPTVTYSWAIAGGTIISGQNTVQVQVQWGQPGIGQLTVTATDTANCTKTISQQVIINFPASVNDIAANDLSIYPNPTNGSFVLKGNITQHEKISLQVLNTLGQIVYADDVVITNSTIQKQYDLSHLANGIYTVALKSTTEQHNIRLVIAK